VLEPSNLAPALFFGFWLVLSVIRQFKDGPPRWLHRLDVLYLVGSWRFFGPADPLRLDYHLFYRDIFDTGELTRWIRITPISSKSSWAVIWNPEQRLEKWFINAAEALFRLKRSGNTEALERSPFYLGILNHVESMARFRQSCARQFAITGSRDVIDPDDLRIMFCSAPHILSPGPGSSPG
jgi:hypothetical protein